MRITSGLVGVGVLVALVVTGCGDKLTGTARDASSARQTTGSASPTNKSPAHVDTAPGTALKFGQSADVRFKAGEVTGLISITVTKIEKGAAADLASIDPEGKTAGKTPYYIFSTIVNESAADLSNRLVSVVGVQADGKGARTVATTKKLDKCPGVLAPRNFTTTGATYQTCDIALAADGGSVTAAAYVKDMYSSKPVTWK